MTLLPIVEACDNYSLVKDSDLVPFFLESTSPAPIGFLFPNVLESLKQYSQSNPTTFLITPGRVSFAPSISTFESRSHAMKQLCEKWRDDGQFSDVIGGRLWRDELYGVYASPFLQISNSSAAFVMERVCCALFGLVTYGVHLTMYTPSSRIWVPRRSKTKQTWPGYLDNSVAGGIPYGMTPKESLIKECMEEASLDGDVARRAKDAGCVSYFYRTAAGWLQPEVEYVYDLLVPESGDHISAEETERFRPKPLDGEVESFELLSIEETIARMSRGEFKPNCALVLLDFLIRHGHVTPETEPNFIEIITRLHGRFGYDAYVSRLAGPRLHADRA